MLMLGAALCAAPAAAQGPLPDTISASALTRAQEAELNRRLARLQQRFDVLASQMDLQAGALRNVAVEIFGAAPDLTYDTYVAMVDEGARQLRAYLTEASERTDADPAVAAVRAQAIAAAQDGRLSEARRLYEQVITANRAARQRQRRAEDVADAADIAESARLMSAGADYLSAAERYAEAVALTPEVSPDRWTYLMRRGEAYFFEAQRNSDPEIMQQAIVAYEGALIAQPRETNPIAWGIVMNAIAVALEHKARYGAPEALERAAEVYRASLLVRTREADPENWALTQTNLGRALRQIGNRRVPPDLEPAAAALEAALSARSRESAPYMWAFTAQELAITYRDMGRFAEARALSERARDAYAETGDTYWPGAVQHFLDALPRY